MKDKDMRVEAFAEEIGRASKEVVKLCKEQGWDNIKTKASRISLDQIEEFKKLHPSPSSVWDVQKEKEDDVSSNNPIEEKGLCDSSQETEDVELPKQKVEVVSEKENNVALAGSYIAMDCHDLREVLTAGYLAPRRYYPESVEFKSHFADSNYWSVFSERNNYGVEEGILAWKKPCLVRIDELLVDSEERFTRTIPASELKEVVFQDEKQKKDFIARVFIDIPTKQLAYVLEPNLYFVLESSEVNDDGSESNAADVRQTLSETNRIMGAIGALISHGMLSASQLKFIEESTEFNLKTLVNLIAEIGVPHSSQSGNWQKRIETILEVLSADEWTHGFAPNTLRESIVDSFNALNDEFASPLDKDSVIEVLDSRAVVPPQMLTGDRNQLLRGLFLFLLSAGGNIMDNLLHVQEDDSYEGKPADVLVNVAILLAGWYKGFRAIPTLKGDDEFGIYRFCSRNLANSVDLSDAYKNNLRVEQDQIGYFTKTTALYDSNYRLATTTVQADPSLMEAHAAILQIDSLIDLRVEFDIDQSLIRVLMRDVVILGSKYKNGIMRWTSTWTMKDKRGKRKWSEQQRNSIATIAKDSSCALYVLVDEFPSCGLHVDQNLSTMDHGEISAHLGWIMETSAKLSEVLEPND